MNSSSRDKSHELVSAGVRHLSGWTDDALTSVTFTTTSDGQVAIITLSRPAARNAWTEIMRNELARCLDAASKVKEIRAVIITGDPEGRAFVRGLISPPQVCTTLLQWRAMPLQAGGLIYRTGEMAAAQLVW